MSLRYVVACALLLAACSKEHADRFVSVKAEVQMVDLEGKPVPGVTAIAVAQPNAFVQPVATGTLTGPDGKSTIEIQASPLFIRGWDPQFRYFTNNYIEIPREYANELPELKIVMVPGCALDALIENHEGVPMANKAVRMLMSHPKRGPWWPDRAVTGADGRLHFRSVPPGIFNIEFKTEDGYTGEVTNAELQPTNRVDLGIVKLRLE
jgi:hypothetical protein